MVDRKTKKGSFNAKMERAHEELTLLGVSPREIIEPGIFRMLRKCGIRIRNAYYLSHLQHWWVVFFALAPVLLLCSLLVNYHSWKLMLQIIVVSAFAAFVSAKSFDFARDQVTTWDEL